MSDTHSLTDHDSVNLTTAEARGLALRIAAGRLENSDMWLEWEDYPNLGEFAFQRLDEQMRQDVAAILRRELAAFEQRRGIDTAYVLERVRS